MDKVINAGIKQDQIDYSVVNNLGFKTQVEHDSVFKDEYGFDYRIVSLELGKYEFDWDCVNRTVMLYKSEDCKGEEIELIYLIKDVDELNMMIKILQ